MTLGLEMAGGVVAAGLGVVSAVWLAFALAYGWWAVPVTAMVALLLVGFVRVAVARSWGWLLPAVPWVLVMIFAVGPTPEGDQIANSWPGLAALAVGTLVFLTLGIVRKSRVMPGNPADDLG